MNVTENDIKEAIKKGAKTASEIQMETGLGAGCTVCVRSLEKHLKVDENGLVVFNGFSTPPS